jgi:hypothetical protein
MKRWFGLLAGLTGLASTVLWFASMMLGHLVAGRQGPGAGPTDADVLVAVHAQAHRQLLSSSADALHLMMVVPVGLFLVAAVRRHRSMGVWIKLLLVSLPVLAGLALAAHFEVQSIASTFVSSGPRTAARAHHLLASASTLTALRVANEAARLIFVGWIAAVSLAAIDAGLVTRQLGYFGAGTAVASVTVPPAGDALFIGFLLAISSLAFGYWPGGRPAAWNGEPSRPSPGRLTEAGALR